MLDALTTIRQAYAIFRQHFASIWARFIRHIWASLTRCFGQICTSSNWQKQIHTTPKQGNTDHRPT